MAKQKAVRPEDPIMGGHTAPLVQCPLPRIIGWGWIMWCDPPQTCAQTGTTGHRCGWRRTAGPDTGKFFSPPCGPQELPDERPRRAKAEGGEASPKVSRTRRKVS